MGRKPSGSKETGSGGRPRDKFLWDHVQILENGRAKCLYCRKEFAAAAQRIRVHLSGEGTGISYCPSVPEEIREEAKKKKLDNMTEVGEDRNAALASVRKKKSVQGGGGEIEEAYLKFLMCTDHSRTCNFICPLEYLKDPLFMKFMERAGAFPVDPTQLSMAALKIKQEVEARMMTVKTKFWNTTGRTLMLINLPSRLSYIPVRVVVIYCPKGIFFVKPTKSDLNSNDSYYEETLQLHSTGLCADEGVQWLSHWTPHQVTTRVNFPRVNFETDNACGCELYSTDSWNKDPSSGEIFNCLHEEIRLSCEKICSESEWAKNLIDIAEEIHWCVYHSKDPCYNYSANKENKVHGAIITTTLEDMNKAKEFGLCAYGSEGAWCDYSVNKKATRMERLMSIIKRESRHKQILSDMFCAPIYSDIDQITKETKFWNEGKNLELILGCVMGMGYMMDTIVPTAGYLGIALDKVDRYIELDARDLAKDALEFWRMLKSELEGRMKGSRLAASYLNPVYFLQQLEKDPLLPINELKAALKDFAIKQGLNLEEINNEVDGFADEFNRIQYDLDFDLDLYHPVKLWEMHGSNLPNLKKCAVMLLNRPLCCMGKQVKEHLYNLDPHGEPDYITTLNLRMMLHLEGLGDDIYKPLDLSELAYGKLGYDKLSYDYEESSISNHVNQVMLLKEGLSRWRSRSLGVPGRNQFK